MSNIVLIAAICVGGYIVVKLVDVLSNAYKEKRKRKWDEEDKDRKRSLELMDKKLEMMKALCYNTDKRIEIHDEEKKEKYVDVLKPLDDNNIQSYFSQLDAAKGNADVSTEQKKS